MRRFIVTPPPSYDCVAFRVSREAFAFEGGCRCRPPDRQPASPPPLHQLRYRAASASSRIYIARDALASAYFSVTKASARHRQGRRRPCLPVRHMLPNSAAAARLAAAAGNAAARRSALVQVVEICRLKPMPAFAAEGRDEARRTMPTNPTGWLFPLILGDRRITWVAPRYRGPRPPSSSSRHGADARCRFALPR